jgi:hypothetical protein
MFSDFIHLEQSIKTILFNDKSLDKYFISDNEWIKIHQYAKIFEIFRKPTKVLQGQLLLIL